MSPWFYTNIPTYSNGVWTTTSFESHDAFRDFVDTLFKEPGYYEFDATTLLFNEQARLFNSRATEHSEGFYSDAPFRSKDYINYWSGEKEKCRKGVIFHNNGKTWYLSRYYYFWINFLKIYVKQIDQFAFPDVWDTQYHVSLYSIRAMLHYKNIVVCKKRQIAMSYYFSSELINEYWFEKGVTCKIGASDKAYIGEVDGTWRYLNEYSSFLNTNTAWYRTHEPGRVHNWQQRGFQTVGNRKVEYGLKSSIRGITFEKSPEKGLGGATKKFMYEEAGIAPTADQTYGYIKPALKMGEQTTGVFTIMGSVGKLEKCEPLKEFLLHPVENGFLPVETNLMDEFGTRGVTGLFIPEQWSRLPYIDKYGNSMIPEAIASIDAEYKELKENIKPEAYQFTISQHPRNIKEAFNFRTQSIFRSDLITDQMRRIEDKTYREEYMDLYYDENMNIKAKFSQKTPIRDYPVSQKMANKESVLVVWERPILAKKGDKQPAWMTYFGSIDPVGVGKTNSSDSLCSIYIYKRPVSVIRHTESGIKSIIENDKIVASWTGRYDDINDTFKQLEMIIEWYNAWTVVENNAYSFITHMIYKSKQRYLVQKDQIMFLKDLGANSNVFQEYGWKNVSTLFKDNILHYGVNFTEEVLDSTVKEDGEEIEKVYGMQRIPDMMLLKEMAAYRVGTNADRIVAFCALAAFAKIQLANTGYNVRVEHDNKQPDQSRVPQNHRSPFNTMGKSSSSRSAFRNLS